MDIEGASGGHIKDWTDIQQVYDLIANEDVNLLDAYDPMSDFNDDLIDVFASSFGLPDSPMIHNNPDWSENAVVPDIELTDNGSSQLKQLLLTKTKPITDLRRQDSPPSFMNLSDTARSHHRNPSSGSGSSGYSSLDGDERKPITRDSSTSPKVIDSAKGVSKTLKFPPCFICGGKASGLHYGVNSCEACKGFFRRYLIRNEEYKCPKGGNCVIVNRNRENCSGCRLQKCFELGMSKEKSKLGRYTLSRRTETIKKVKALEKNESKPPSQDKVSTISPAYFHNRDHNYSENIRTLETPRVRGRSPVDEFNEKLTGELVRAMDEIKPYGAEITTHEDVEKALKNHYERYKVKIEMYGEMKSIPKEEYYKLLKEYGIDIDGRMNALKIYVREIERVTERYCNFAKLIPGFKQISRRDQSTLLKADRCDFFLILMNEAYCTKYQTILSRNGLAYHLEEISDKHFSREAIMKICDTYLRWQKLGLRKEEKALIIAITLFFTDRCNIDDRKNVERIQLSLVAMLRAQLERTHKAEAVKRFAKIIDCLTFMRDSSEMYIKEYKELCDDETVVEAVPMLTEFLLEDW